MKRKKSLEIPDVERFTKSKTIQEGWINTEDFELFGQMLRKDGIAHADIFKTNPEVDYKDEFPLDFPMHFKKVRITIEEID